MLHTHLSLSRDPLPVLHHLSLTGDHGIGNGLSSRTLDKLQLRDVVKHLQCVCTYGLSIIHTIHTIQELPPFTRCHVLVYCI